MSKLRIKTSRARADVVELPQYTLPPASPKKDNAVGLWRLYKREYQLSTLIIILLIATAAYVRNHPLNHHKDDALNTTAESRASLPMQGGYKTTHQAAIATDTLNTKGAHLVEFNDALVKLPLHTALDIKALVSNVESELLFSPEIPLEQGDGLSSTPLSQDFISMVAAKYEQLRQRQDINGGDSNYKVSSSSDIKLLIGVTSACCTEISKQRRDGIRKTWAATVRARYSEEITVKFFLSQPQNATLLSFWLPILQQEADAHADIVVVRGKDSYNELPSKTFALLRYMLAAGYTHVLKTDDDTWVRPHKLVKALYTTTADDQQHVSKQVETMKQHAWLKSYEQRRPITTDGIVTYDARPLVQMAEGGDLGKRVVMDDVDGKPITPRMLSERGKVLPSFNQDGSLMNQHQADSSSLSDGSTVARIRMSGAYMGSVEVSAGYVPVRDPTSKWFVDPIVLPDEDIPQGVQYAAGWGYLLSRDLIEVIVAHVNVWQKHREEEVVVAPPKWFKYIHWEDTLVGMILDMNGVYVENHPGFKAAWRTCSPDTVVRHLDVDSPKLLEGLQAQDASGLWEKKPIQCSSGGFLPGDYSGWKQWKDQLEKGVDA